MNGYAGWSNLQIRNSSLCEYFEFAEKKQRTKKQIETKKNLSKTYGGEITVCSRKNISRAIQLLLMGSPRKWYENPITGKRNHHQLTFITVTFSCHSIVKLSEEYEKSLKPFLRWLRERKKVKNYVWKAEYQKRGQLHYHITTNEFIRHDELRQKWNSIQFNNGYLDDYHKLTGHYNAPSTEIDAVYKVENIESYLIKYLQKEVKSEDKEAQDDLENNNVRGKIWGCSENLRGKKYYTIQNVDIPIYQAIQSKIDNGIIYELPDIEHCRFFKCKKKKDFKNLLNKNDIKTIIDYAKSDFKNSIHYRNYNDSVGCCKLLDTIIELDKKLELRKKLVEKFNNQKQNKHEYNLFK